jgi:hypothetical protein
VNLIEWLVVWHKRDRCSPWGILLADVLRKAGVAQGLRIFHSACLINLFCSTTLATLMRIQIRPGCRILSVEESCFRRLAIQWCGCIGVHPVNVTRPALTRLTSYGYSTYIICTSTYVKTWLKPDSDLQPICDFTHVLPM